MTTFSGLILTGGQSSRMGQDKYAIQFQGESLIKKMVRIHSEIFPQVIIACHPQQKSALQLQFPAHPQLIMPEDSKPHQGPLAGLRNACGHFPSAVFWLTGCDMPFLTSEVFTRLQSHWHEDRLAVIAQLGTQWQPLCGLYQAKKVLHWVKPTDHSPLFFLQRHAASVCPVLFSDHERAFFTNLNCTEDVQKYE